MASHLPHRGRHFSVRGTTLVDVVVGIGIITLVFLAIFGAFRLSIELVFSTKAKTGAVSLVTERIEFVRSLPYDSVGTVGGIPPGNIAQIEQMDLNGVTYTIRTIIQYTDAPQDGLDENDENGVTADYKTVKVEALWSIRDSTRSTFAVTSVSPVGQESLAGGGTLRVNVFGADVTAIGSADVHVVNSSTVPAIDTTLQTNTSGTVSLPGASEASGYEITVTKTGYSTAQTYGVTAELPNPSPIHVSVVESQTTTTSFFIDLLGVLRFFTFEPAGPGSFEDTFVDQSKLTATSSVETASGSLTLLDSESGYAPNGNAFSNFISPQLLSAWDELTFSASTSPDAPLRVSLYYFDGAVYTLVPDDDLPSNSTGLTEGVTDISTLDIETYGSLQLGTFLNTNNPSTTPELFDWEVSYTAGPTPLGSVALSLHGDKTTGTDSGGLPVYKYDDTFTTNSFGEWFVDPAEWDAYTLSLQNPNEYDIIERCPFSISLDPAQDLSVNVTLSDNSAHSLLAYVTDDGGTPLQGATVTLSGPGSGIGATSACGQTFFENLLEDTYTITVSRSGFQMHNDTVDVSGDAEFSAGLTPN